MATNGTGEANTRIYAPLDGLSSDAIKRKVDDFITETGLDDDRSYLEKGAFLVQSKQAFDRDREDLLRLKDSEKEWLQLEQTNKWHQPPALWRLVALCALGAMVQGWDESAVNGCTQRILAHS